MDADPLSDAAPGRLRLFQSTDGRQFRLSRISDRAENLHMEATVVSGDRLLVYAIAGEGSDHRRLLFEAAAGER